MAARCVENGLLILTAKQSLRMLPPLTITYDEIDRGLEILEKTLSEINSYAVFTPCTATAGAT